MIEKEQVPLEEEKKDSHIRPWQYVRLSSKIERVFDVFWPVLF